MAGTHRRTSPRKLAVSAWLGTGVAAVGMSAFLLGSAAVAGATTDGTDSSSSASGNSGGTSPSHKKTENAGAGQGSKPSDGAGSPTKSSTDSDGPSKTSHEPHSSGTGADSNSADTNSSSDDSGPKTKAPASSVTHSRPTAAIRGVLNNSSAATSKQPDTDAPKATAATKPATASIPSAPAASTEKPAPAETPAAAPEKPAVTPTAFAAETSTTAPIVTAAAATTTTPAPALATSPTGSTGTSGILSILATAEQAIGSAAQNTEQTLKSAAASTGQTSGQLLGTTPAPAAGVGTPAPAGASSVTANAAAASSSPNIDTLKLAVSSAQATLYADTFGRGDWLGGFGTFGAQFQLAIASWALNTYTANNPGFTSFYANNANNPFLAGFAAALLNWNNSLPGMALGSINAAEGMSGNADANGMLNQAVKGRVYQTAANGPTYGYLPLVMKYGLEPVVYVSINGGPMVPVLVDTGSNGLVISSDKIGAAGLGNAVDTGIGAYSGGLTYNYSTYNTTIDFGNGIITAPTGVNVVTSATQATTDSNGNPTTVPTTLAQYLAGNGVVGVLGIGSNAVGPDSFSPTTALPGDLNDGVFLNESANELQFGPNPGTPKYTVAGSPNVVGSVSINGGPRTPINLLIDSGGVTGTIPDSYVGNNTVSYYYTDGSHQYVTTTPNSDPAYDLLANGTQVTVYDNIGTPLYSYTITDANAPFVTSDASNANLMNSGAQPFLTNPMYISYTVPGGATIFNY